MIKNDLADLAGLPARVTGFFQPCGVSPQSVDRVLLTLEEMLSNTIKYGYSDSAEHAIEIDLRVISPSESAPGDACEIVLTLTDDGGAFDPLALPLPDTSAPVEDRPIGGLGVHLVRSIASKMQYQRSGDKNQVEISFKKTVDPAG